MPHKSYGYVCSFVIGGEIIKFYRLKNVQGNIQVIPALTDRICAVKCSVVRVELIFNRLFVAQYELNELY
ncbi:hypothetical protein GCM10009332_06870 [Shewanella gelidii]|uniref:Uncharacterized protein n=1 Tax=Shewanella gelidii TaxID=1642821 RepID=A0A917JLX4_9GAMM|nr:hypothetical protein GCM10009332_06870 [Shewanella gelidii]